MNRRRQDGIDPVARSRARRRALQAVYAWQMSGTSARDVIAQFAHEQAHEVADLEYFEDLVRGVDAHCNDLDQALQPFLDRDIEQVDAIERAALRIATYELRLRRTCRTAWSSTRRSIGQALRRRARPHLRQRRARPCRRGVARDGSAGAAPLTSALPGRGRYPGAVNGRPGADGDPVPRHVTMSQWMSVTRCGALEIMVTGTHRGAPEFDLIARIRARAARVTT